MLKSITIFLGLFPFCCFAQNINFQDLQLEEAIAKAQEEEKDVFIDGYAVWCGPCKRMDSTTFQDPEVSAYFNDAFVSIKLDMEKDHGKEVAKQFHVKAFPTYIFLDAEGKVLHKAAGYFESTEFVDLAKMRTDDTSIGTLRARYDSGSRDRDLLHDLLDQEYALLDPHYMEVAHEVAKLESDWATEDMRTFIFKYTNSAVSPMFDYLVEQKQTFSDQFGQGATFGKIEELVSNRSFEVQETSIEEMTKIFELVYPKDAKEMSSKYRLSYHRQRGDRKLYAASAIDHYKQFPSRDPVELNEVGMTFSRVIEDQILLKKVLPLVKKSIKIDDAHYNNDTLAALLFKLGNIDAARKAAKKAIDLAQSSGDDSSFTEELLEAINSHASN